MISVYGKSYLKEEQSSDFELLTQKPYYDSWTAGVARSLNIPYVPELYPGPMNDPYYALIHRGRIDWSKQPGEMHLNPSSLRQLVHEKNPHSGYDPALGILNYPNSRPAESPDQVEQNVDVPSTDISTPETTPKPTSNIFQPAASHVVKAVERIRRGSGGTDVDRNPYVIDDDNIDKINYDRHNHPEKLWGSDPALGSLDSTAKDPKPEAVEPSKPETPPTAPTVSKPADQSIPSVAPSSSTAPSDTDSPWYQDTLNWMDDNKLATAGLIGAPLALAGSYLAYKKFKNKKNN